MTDASKASSAVHEGEDPVVFTKHIPGLGDFSLRHLRLDKDAPIVHDWVNREYAKYWGLVGTTVEQVRQAYREITEPEHAKAYLGFHNDTPAFLIECYRAAEDRIGTYYNARPGDHGMHILVAPAERRIPNFTWHVFTVVMDFMFSDESVERVVVEPDIRNEKIHTLNRRAGFVYDRQLELPEKTACLAFCTRSQYAAALEREGA